MVGGVFSIRASFWTFTAVTGICGLADAGEANMLVVRSGNPDVRLRRGQLKIYDANSRRSW